MTSDNRTYVLAPVKGERPMSSIDELVELLTTFTPDQLERFLNAPLTQSILRAGEEAGPYPPAAS